VTDLKGGFLVVPHDVPVNLSSAPDRAGSLMNLVTNWWVERCLYGKRLVNPADDILSRPFEHQSISGEIKRDKAFYCPLTMTATGFSGLTVNSTAFVGIELLHVTRIVTMMGTEISPLVWTSLTRHRRNL
jgi:DNA replication regulator DPB11